MKSSCLSFLLVPFATFALWGAAAQSSPPGTDFYLPDSDPYVYGDRSQCAVISDPRPAPSGNYYENYVIIEDFGRPSGFFDTHRMTIKTSQGVVQHLTSASSFGDSGNLVISRDGRSIAYTTTWGTAIAYSNDFGQTFTTLGLPGVAGYQSNSSFYVHTGANQNATYIAGNMAFDAAGNLYVAYLRLRDNLSAGQFQNTAKLFGAIIGANGSLLVPPIDLGDIWADWPNSELFSSPGPMLTTVATENHIVVALNVGFAYHDGISPNPLPNKRAIIVVDTRNLSVNRIAWDGSQNHHLLGGTDWRGTVAQSSMVSDGRSIYLLTRTESVSPSQQFRYWVRKFDPNPTLPTNFFPNTAPAGADPFMDLDSPSVPTPVELETLLGLPLRPPVPAGPGLLQGLLFSFAAPWPAQPSSGGGQVALLSYVRDYSTPTPTFYSYNRSVASGFNTGSINVTTENAMDVTDSQLHSLGLITPETWDFGDLFMSTLVPHANINIVGQDMVTTFCRRISGTVGTLPIDVTLFGADIK